MSKGTPMINWDASSWVGHSMSTAAILAGLIGILPAVGTILATFAAFIWYAVQVYESPTMKKYLARRHKRKIAKLQRHISELEAELQHSKDNEE